MSPRQKKILIVLLSFLLVGTALGVYYYYAYHRLGFQLVGVGLGNVVPYASVEIRLTLEVSNPNVLPVYVPSGSFDVYVNDQHLAGGDFGSFTVGGSGRQRITIPVTVTIIDIVTTVYGLITGGGTVTVRLEGSADLVLFRIPFSTTLYDAKFT
jgi:LEA14-like dessication related protein